MKLTNNLLKVLCLLMLLGAGITGCKDDDEGTPIVELTITGIAPTSARIGEEVVISGTGFNNDFTQNQVKFTGSAGFINAVVKSATNNTLTVDVPEGAGNGPIQVITGGETVTSTMSFTLDTSLGSPILSSLNPTNGFAGIEVTISGASFGEDVNSVKVMFGSTEAEIVSMTGTSIVAKVPLGIATGEVKVTVTRDGVGSESPLNFTVNATPVAVKTVYWCSSGTDAGIYKGEVTSGAANITALYLVKNYEQVSGAASVSVDPAGGYIYWVSNAGGLFRADINGGGDIEEVMSSSELPFPYDLALDLNTRSVYASASTNDFSKDFIYKKQMDGSGEGEVVYSFNDGATYGPDAVKLFINDSKLYWTDGLKMAVVQGSLDGKDTPKVLYDQANGLQAPKGIAFDPDNNAMYIADYGSGATPSSNIYRGTLNGEGELSVIVAQGDNVNRAIDLEIDLENGYIFWMNTSLNNEGSAEVMRSNLDGSKVEKLFDGFVNPGFFDIEIGEVDTKD
ncbi:IPT/TIG domain-containing protein [Fulvivirga sediminis]|uniref:IPT/TIG domain-containing protein n=1 Tax=Fulvivirga sediminis TaxID=2803949 RepID=A0A937K3F9_9BACT|nr:IPT/TIG domain-containing protein [Fulvivirga sediminis]MBL3658932.1 IPT/TIG domain-containing protein [Fulvivirga sediminis]